MKKKTPQARQPTRTTRPIVLDSFTQEQMQLWDSHGFILQQLADRVYFELERQRVAHYDALCAALRSSPSVAVDVTNWSRVTDYRWSMTPLSSVGSLNGIGGRFNIGHDLDRARSQAFSALYIAESVETAFGEYFGGKPSTIKRGLSLSDLALRKQSSFTVFLLQGRLEQVLDLRSDESIEAFSEIISRCDISKETKRSIQEAGLPPRLIMRSAQQLREHLLASPSAWRLEPQAYGIPAACQIFGKFVYDAGFEGILYPSQQGSGSCLAVYPRNFRDSDAYIKVTGSVPSDATYVVVDKDHLP